MAEQQRMKTSKINWNKEGTGRTHEEGLWRQDHQMRRLRSFDHDHHHDESTKREKQRSAARRRIAKSLLNLLTPSICTEVLAANRRLNRVNPETERIKD